MEEKPGINSQTFTIKFNDLWYSGNIIDPVKELVDYYNLTEEKAKEILILGWSLKEEQ